MRGRPHEGQAAAAATKELSVWSEFYKLLTTFEESMPKEADKQACQASDGEENLCRYPSWKLHEEDKKKERKNFQC